MGQVKVHLKDQEADLNFLTDQAKRTHRKPYLYEKESLENINLYTLSKHEAFTRCLKVLWDATENFSEF